ncbi:MAG TPA: hypothetical protein DEA60_04440 [Thermotoga naphthophila]|uniref:Uncharacterized protein n=2 Tax=Thermotoga TaxID=2335 RepID=Q9WY01_THEMA|nr:hypothetical protein TM_0154 [Thermotoga maritima MSB8]CAI44270.1 hypothetical protein [Thermotoga petrophila RKU-10]HBU00308.1 hypothetical protein [Thermotoga petrophila]
MKTRISSSRVRFSRYYLRIRESLISIPSRKNQFRFIRKNRFALQASFRSFTENSLTLSFMLLRRSPMKQSRTFLIF